MSVENWLAGKEFFSPPHQVLKVFTYRLGLRFYHSANTIDNVPVELVR